MTDNLDRILMSEEAVRPSDGFLASVMEAVRQCCDFKFPIRFPWGRFAAGLVGGLSCTVLSVILLAPELLCLRPRGTEAWIPIPQWLCAPEMIWTVIVLIVSWLVVRLSVEFTSE